MAVALGVPEIVKMHVLAHALEHARHNARVHVNMVAMEVVQPIVMDFVRGAVETARTHVKVDVLETLEMHQIHVDADPHVHLHADLHVLMSAPMVVVEIVATNVPQHAQTLAWVLAQELRVGALT